MPITEKFIETIGNLGESIGLNRTVCQIYALLYITPEPLSPAEIGRALGVSKGNISINIKKLEEWNAVKKVWKKGYTRSFYTANDDLEGIIFEKLKTGLTKRNRILTETITELKKSIQKSDRKLKKYYSDRLSKIEGILKQTELFTKNIDILKSFLKK
ncbi:MAG TPA: MarR family transcriptional regulator [bacterium]|nr:MarR family transcriptional regulator [bacterium]HPP29740.1 MarR family transcriptional regulator [bacterium]